MRRLAAMMRLRESDLADDASAPITSEAESVGWAIRTAGARMRSSCLVESLAAVPMLRRRGLRGTLSLGVAKGDGGDVSAHSWVACGSTIVTGAHSSEGFSVVATYRIS